ncbi:hypothetical protein Zmor_021468 [Zophobas morio]|uniref:Uncharacterized protein n=1 Tax=Zophobas morio TaxID=2755281 RepID=A0AA38I6F0_9CUCU|nr:hypothetical protein Zmor_021468 [Zophobas morio]
MLGPTMLDPTYEEKHMSSVLGMIWNRDDDTLHLCLENLIQVDTSCTVKKLILSITNNIFNPLGFVSPTFTTENVTSEKLDDTIELDYTSSRRLKRILFTRVERFEMSFITEYP